MTKPFRDRADAGRQLAALVGHLRGDDTIVLGLPRGGVVVGHEIAQAIGAPLDALNVRKLGVPWHEELAMGAIAAGGMRVLNNDVIMTAGITQGDLDSTTALQRVELDRREHLYRQGRPFPPLHGRTVIVVDDGIATGASVRAALAVVRAQKPGRLVLAAPVAQRSVAEELAPLVDEIICVLTPDDLFAISAWYEHFPQLTDREVQALLVTAVSP